MASEPSVVRIFSVGIPPPPHTHAFCNGVLQWPLVTVITFVGALFFLQEFPAGGGHDGDLKRWSAEVTVGEYACMHVHTDTDWCHNIDTQVIHALNNL